MDNETELEVADLLKRYSDQRQASVMTRAELRIAGRMETRAKLRRGELPDHINGACVQCVRAILTLDHDAACDLGKQHVYLILPQGKD
jgi:hypothetical protein